MFNYLYYCFYRLWLKSSIAEGAVIMAMLTFSVLLTTNILTIWGIFVQYNMITYPSDFAYWVLFSMVTCVVFTYLLIKGKYKKIIDKYEQRYTDKHSGIILFVYIVISVSLFLVEALYRQGKL
jgi:hypothetical protein